jgi:nucleoside-diphosphate-sugar epimerase
MNALLAVTGATGFVGRALSREFASLAFRVRAVVRTVKPSSVPSDSNITNIAVGDINPYTDWSSALTGVDCVVHCAARAHLMHETAGNALAAYRAVNVDGVRRLAEQAAAAGVRRLVCLSSIKVNGERTAFEAPFSLSDQPAPEDVYGLSKWEAEQVLWEIASQTGMEVVVVRPPLVYGQGVKGNFARLLDLVYSRVHLPLAAVNNRRSFIGLDNLVDLLIRCVDHPKAAGQTLLVSDGQDLSTPELLHMIADAMGRPARLLHLPVPLLRFGGRVLGRLNEVDRLVSSLQVDSSATRELLGWNPPVSVEEGVRRMVRGYLSPQ